MMAGKYVSVTGILRGYGRTALERGLQHAYDLSRKKGYGNTTFVVWDRAHNGDLCVFSLYVWRFLHDRRYNCTLCGLQVARFYRGRLVWVSKRAIQKYGRGVFLRYASDDTDRT